jgi:tRNA nucleotidyltransferase (CCA-adding enzyme)
MRLNEVILHEEKLDVKSVVTSSIKKLDKVFKSNNYELRIVGGAVRDLALGKTPKDIDLATDATPDEMIAILDKAGIRHKPTGLEHGTITAILDKEPFEITTLRADTETDGRHAEVEFVKSWEEDAKRRDLTYNAMSMDMEGKVYDYFDGMDDLQDKVSNFVGDADERIKEDYLRILRYFRFQGRLSTPTWDKDTLKAISSNVKGLQQISAERIWQEMSKVLSGNNVASVVEYMALTGTSKIIGLSTNELNKVKDKGNPIVALAQMGNTTDIVKRWRLSNNESALLDFLVKNKNNSLDQKKVEDMIADGVSKDLISALATLQGKDVNIDAEVPNFPVTGADLIANGMKPGPEMGAKLGQLKQKWKDSNFKATKDELLGESKLFEAVHRFMTGHGVTFAGKKHDEIEIEVTGTDNVNKKYIVTILAPKELFGKQTQISSKYMNRGPWTKTKVDNVFEATESKPIVYVDMDGVLADFFSEWAKMAGVKTGNYKDIPPANIDPTLDKMIGTDFFAQLPKFSTADKLIQMIISHFGSYKILSSPLRNDHENSKKHKIDWIGRKLKIKPEETIISSNKGSYATQADGTPNILIDDLGKNIQNWMNNGGLGIKYQADEDPLSKVHKWLSQFKKGAETQEVATERQEHIFEEDNAIK